jgi:hypothetical protein
VRLHRLWFAVDCAHLLRSRSAPLSQMDNKQGVVELVDTPDNWCRVSHQASGSDMQVRVLPP